MDKKVYGTGVFFISILVLLIIRVFTISIVDGGNYTQMAVAQRTKKIPIQSARGVIYDRNMLAITQGRTTLKVAVIPNECEDLQLVSEIVDERISGNKMQIYSLNALNENTPKLFKMKGVIVFNTSERYNDDGILSHIIGYYYDQGGFGIERAFDDKLAVNKEDSITVTTDAHNKAIAGLGYKLSEESNYKGIKLTIDYHIQKLAEKAMNEEGITGAAIVAEVSSGDILAMVSRPNFSQNDLVKYLNSPNGELVNRALAPYDVGSIFKTVLASAAIEEGIFTPESTFECTGKLDVNGKEFVCNKEEGHGKLTLSQGIAYSCNSVFYQVGLALGIDTIAKYAKNFGYGDKVMKISDMGESAGYIPDNSNALPQEIANMSIGQGKIQVTPLQVTDMMVTIAGGGQRKQLTLVKGFANESGECTDVEPVYLGEVISKSTAEEISKMLIDTVDYGTGTSAKISQWGAGGKTGSAETGWLKDGELMTHGWFAGFFPAENPKYVCVVLAENGKQGGTSAAPVFRKIGEGIKKLEK